MEYAAALIAGIAVALVVVGLGTLLPATSPEVRRRLKAMRAAEPPETAVRREPRERLQALVGTMGERLAPREDSGRLRARLVRAGYYAPTAVSLYYGVQLLLVVLGALVFAALATLRAGGPALLLLAVATGGLMGWVLPRLFLVRRIRRRHREIQRSLPDMLDLLVACVEAGLGLNQALVRVSEEIAKVSSAMSQELQIVNLEIRAGTPRDEALRNFGQRTGVDDVRSLVAMLVQTDRFGTSVARSLRVHADTIRTKRRQRAEEAAAKTTIKLVIPLALFIFPAMFVVILGPAILHILGLLRSAT